MIKLTEDISIQKLTSTDLLEVIELMREIIYHLINIFGLTLVNGIFNKCIILKPSKKTWMIQETTTISYFMMDGKSAS